MPTASIIASRLSLDWMHLQRDGAKRGYLMPPAAEITSELENATRRLFLSRIGWSRHKSSQRFFAGKPEAYQVGAATRQANVIRPMIRILDPDGCR